MRPRRSGITLFQLLLILALLAILFALFLPALIRARADALQQAKLNNLKQISLGLLNREAAYNEFPPGNDQFNFSAAAQILPFVEQDNLYRQVDFKKPIDDPKNVAVAAVVVKTYLSPLDPRMGVKENLAATNYVFNAGGKPSLADNDGMFFQDSKVKINDVTDGTSNTLAVVETLKGDGGTEAKDVKRQHVLLGKDDLKGITDDAGVKQWKDNKSIAGDRCASWMDGRFLQTTFTATRKPNDERPDVNCAGLGGLSGPRSLDGTLRVAFVDGSARIIKDSVDFKVWQALCTRNGGEAVDPSGL